MKPDVSSSKHSKIEVLQRSNTPLVLFLYFFNRLSYFL